MRTTCRTRQFQSSGEMSLPTAGASARRALLSPDGALRAALNMSNYLLVSACDPGQPVVGVAPDVARALARSLGASEVALLPFPNPGAIMNAARRNAEPVSTRHSTRAFDVALIDADPKRTEVLHFSPPYADIQATYGESPRPRQSKLPFCVVHAGNLLGPC